VKKRILILVVVALALAFGSAVLADSLVMVEDFQGYDVGTDLIGGVGGWDTVNPSNTQGYVALDPVSPPNQVGYFRRTGNPPTGGRYLDLDENIIPDGSTGEFSIRFLFHNNPNSAFGLSCLPQPGPPGGSGAGTQLSVLFRLNTYQGAGRLIYMTDQGHSIGQTLATGLTHDTWYQVWATVDNANDTVSNIYLQGGTEFPTKTLVSPGPHSFNIWATVDPTHTDLLTFFVFEQGYTAGVYLDEIQIGLVPAPRGEKEAVRDTLLALLDPGTGDKKTDDLIEKAIYHLEKSLADDLWEEDGLHLTKKGKKVFEEEKKAVHELMKIEAPPDVSAEINSLVEADQILAQTAIDDAAGGDPKDIAKAQEEMTKALEDIDKGDFDKAIKHYKKAWDFAQKAVK